MIVVGEQRQSSNVWAKGGGRLGQSLKLKAPTARVILRISAFVGEAAASATVFLGAASGALALQIFVGAVAR